MIYCSTLYEEIASYKNSSRDSSILTKVEQSFRKNGKRPLSAVGIPLPRNKAKTGESNTNKQT
jgi:hypothetical protein